MKLSRELQIKHLTQLFTFLLIVWGFYRLLFQIPEPFDELLVKPIVWLGAVFIFLKKEKGTISSLGITFNKFFPSVYLGLTFGFVFALEALFVNYLKYRGLNFGANIGELSFYLALFVSLITAISEEITFRGYFFGKLLTLTKNEWKANIISTTCWSLIHLPIAIFDWRLSITSLITYSFLTFVFGFGSAFLYGRTRNIASSIILHVMWAWPIILFR